MTVVRIVVSQKDREFISLRRWIERRILGVFGTVGGYKATTGRFQAARENCRNSEGYSERD